MGALFLIGLGTGWIAGLSMTSVVAAILSTVLGALSILVAAMTGTSGKAAEIYTANPKPLAFFVLGLALAAPAGVAVRAHGWLGPEIVRADGAAKSAGNTGASNAAVTQPARPATGLMAVASPAECDKLRKARGPELRQAFRTAHSEALQVAGNHIADTLALDSLRTAFCRESP